MFSHNLNDLNGASLSRWRQSVNIQTRNWRKTCWRIQKEFLLHTDSARTWWATFFQWKLTIFELISFDVTFCVSQRELEMLKSGRAPHHRGPSPTIRASSHSSDGFSRERSATSCSTLRLLSLRYSLHQKQKTNKKKTCLHVLVWITPIFFFFW